MNPFETTLERVGRILSSRYNISVRCKGNACKTDGRTIWLPSLPDEMSDSLWQLTRGELDHETAHILFTDFDGEMKDFRAKWGDFGFDLLNVIEDVRINALMEQEYPGSKINLHYCTQEICKNHPVDQMELPVRFLCALYLAGSGLPYDRYGTDAIELVDQFSAEASQFRSLKSTDEACQMAASILQRLNLPHRTESSSDNQEEASDNQQESGAGGNESKETKQSEAQLDTQGYQSTGNPIDLKSTLEQRVSEEMSDGSNHSYRVFDASLDQVRTARSRDSGEQYSRLRDQVRPQVSALRQQLIRTLKARDTTFWVNDQEEGTVNSRALHELVSRGSSKVFRQTQYQESTAVALSLLIDCSGSMNGERMDLARKVAVLFADTLDSLRYPFEVIGFTTQPSKRAVNKLVAECGMDLTQLSEYYTRFFPCQFLVFKEFGESMRLFRSRLPSMNALEYTPVGEALILAAKRMIHRSEPRKIILVLTDGEPYTGNSIQIKTVHDHVHRAVHACQKAGIEPVGIGMKTPEIGKFFPHHINVDDLSTLPTSFFKTFSALLRKHR